MQARSRQWGFTLVEMVMTIVLLGIVGGMVAVYMRSPVQAYLDSARRAALTDVADTTARRIARDLHKALPNSVRVPAATCIEFIPTKTGGRYRMQDRVAGDGSALDFSIADTGFNMLGSNSSPDLPTEQRIVANDLVAVYNLGISGADAYAGNNTSVVTGLGTETSAPIETPITISAKQFPLASGSSRFHVIPGGEQVVGYVCNGGYLRRYVKTLPYANPGACPTPAATDPVIATNVGSCSFVYGGPDLLRNSLMTLTLSLTDSSANETVSLQHEVHINNAP